MSAKRIRAKAAYDAGNCTLYTEKSASCVGRKYYVLPATAEAYERMVEQMCKAWIRSFEYIMPVADEHRRVMRAGLRSIGITPVKKGTP